jgi:sugar phosphate isomerase/epimerase
MRGVGVKWPIVGSMRVDQIALQLWTVRDLVAADPRAALRAVADVGYRSVELAHLADTPASELAPVLRECGLQAMGEHIGIDRLRADIGSILDRLTALDCPRAIVPWLPEEDRRTAHGVRRLVAELNSLGRVLEDRGFRLGYHNHAFEFEPLDESTVWDILLAELAPNVDFELDVYWAAVGGRDPVATIEQAAGRIRLLHMKDRAPGTEPHDAPAGEGTLGMSRIVAAGRDASVEWYVAEQDEPREALADIATAYRNLADLSGSVA